MYAVINTGGKQYKVSEKDVIEIERLPFEEGKKVDFDEVLAVGNGSDLKLGTPTVKGAKVQGEVLEHFRGPKLTVFKMKRRKGYRRKKGHRQELTKVKIASVSA